MLPSSPKTADQLRNLLTLQHAVGGVAVVCPVLIALVVMFIPEAVSPSEEPLVMLGAGLFVAASLGLDSMVARRMWALRGARAPSR